MQLSNFTAETRHSKMLPERLRQPIRNLTLSICRNPEKSLKAFGIILKMKEDNESLIKRQLLQTILKEYQWIIYMTDCQFPVDRTRL